MKTRRHFLGTAALAAAAAAPAPAQTAGVTRYVRFRKGNLTAQGILEGETIRQISGDLFGAHKPTGATHKLAGVKLLWPCEPTKVLALAGNFKSHIGNRPPFKNPEIFYKPLTSLQNPGDPIVLPPDHKRVDYEGELVIVIGKTAKNVSLAQAKDYIFGVTCGNDVSEREWQNGKEKDVQWWRAKGADTFGPVGPAIAHGINYAKLRLRTIVNGKVVQDESTADLLFNCEQMVSYISKYVTLLPGDMIFTGTPQTTQPLKAGDVVEIDIEGIGVLKNPVVKG
ncbi:MAG: fumarylacetoacetate hydrolase family protein [Acidobacteria bacterium]|nr:fumarylacetoacetate hydrolase family protein [Acidobacteriota bacterium]